MTHDPGGKTRIRWRDGAIVTADFSECGKFRYSLTESWNPKRPCVGFLLMNPSTADIEYSDPTLHRTGTFAREWGYGAQSILNVHAYRATDNERLLKAWDPVGPENYAVIIKETRRCKIVVLAYGQPPKPLRSRANDVVEMLIEAEIPLAYLRLAKDGTPCHPLYLPGNLTPIPFGG